MAILPKATHKFNSLYLFIYYSSSPGVHVQIMQVCYIGIHMPWWWFAAPITLSSTLGISPNAIPPKFPPPTVIPLLFPHPPTPWQALLYDIPLPVSMCSHCSTPTYEWEHVVFGFLFLCQHAENNGFQIQPCPCKGHELILFNGCIVFHGPYVPHFLYPVYHWWTFALVQVFPIVNSATMNIRVHVSL